MARVSRTGTEAFLKREFPQATFEIESFDEDSVTIRRRIGIEDLRPGGTVSGPSMMSLADCAIYIAVLREIGLIGPGSNHQPEFQFSAQASREQRHSGCLQNSQTREIACCW